MPILPCSDQVAWHQPRGCPIALRGTLKCTRSAHTSAEWKAHLKCTISALAHALALHARLPNGKRTALAEVHSHSTEHTPAKWPARPLKCIRAALRTRRHTRLPNSNHTRSSALAQLCGHACQIRSDSHKCTRQARPTCLPNGKRTHSSTTAIR